MAEKVKKVTSRRRWIRRILGLMTAHIIVTTLLVAIAFLLGWGSIARSLPDLHGWHLDSPESEFRRADAKAGYTLADYLAQEDRAFTELAALMDGPWSTDDEGTLNRFMRGSKCNPDTLLDRNWNRTFVLESETPVGGALLLHGLSDSPYSLRVLGERLHREGWTVVGLRLPGHGTCPRALAEVSYQDWTAAVSVAARGLADRLPEGAPLVLVGFSNGGALSVHYAAETIEDPTLAKVDGVVLFSPMIGITPFARLTQLYRAVALIPGFKKAAWQGISAEVDPFKYSSWPNNASEQAWRLTRNVEARLARLSNEGKMGDMAPVLAFQSVADATVIVPRLISGLFDRLEDDRSKLVLFDVNRAGVLDELLNSKAEDRIIPLLDRDDLGFELTLVTNAGPDSVDVKARRRTGDGYLEEPLGVAWPREVFSLSHGSPPISPDDPVYGTAEATAATGLPLGSLQLRGERGVLRISESLIIRLRHNPFYGFAEDRAMAWLEKVVVEPAGQ